MTVTGPRQAGKSTLCKALFPDKAYINLEDLSTRRLVQGDPQFIQTQYPEGAVIDEIQRVPELCSFIQTWVDRTKKTGLYVLTGSSQFELMHHITQSLAGRTAIGRILPFSYSELYGSTPESVPNLDELLYHGFFPRIHDKKLQPTEALSFYVATYLERDVRNILNIKEWSKFDMFLRLLAGRSGQILNIQALASEIGLSNNTITSWIGVLEQGNIIYKLRPYFANLGKRLIKSPKIYILDSGLLCYLLNIFNPSVLSLHPLRGQVFESFVVTELLKERYNQGLPDNLYYYRDQRGLEVDLIIDEGTQLILGEIISAATFHPDFLSSLIKVQKLLNKPCRNILFTGSPETPYLYQGIEIRGYRHVGTMGPGY
ncbi:MAG: ATP-binding protein [Spirochaetota bacterium]